ncbi:subito [Carabus blaptoides fortunei]
MSATKCASFIRARDPSILAWNRPAINPSVKMDLCSAFTDESSSGEKDKEHLQVYLRLKPCDHLNEIYDIENNVLVCRVPRGSQFMRNIQDGNKVKRQYSFTKIYGPDTNQVELFNDCIKHRMLDFLNGKNGNIFTYGTSGSGKTYTILGTATNPGIIPRALEYMFRTLPPIDEVPILKPTESGDVELLEMSARRAELNLRNNFLNSSSTKDRSLHIKTYKAMRERLSVEPTATIEEGTNVAIGIWVSFAEVYNEYIYDLLQPKPARGKQRPKLRLGQDEKGNTYIKNLTNISVSSGLEAYEILQYGMHHLNYASTSVNAHSSRSHCIFTIKLAQVYSTEVQITQFNFCDLAGSERAKHTNNIGVHLKESNNINTSLHVLGRCIKTIRASQKNINMSSRAPFRESKLTRLFQRSLIGGEGIAMIVNVNPHRDMFDEGQHVLNFSAVAQDITVEAEIKPTKKRFSQYIHSTALPSISESEQSELDILRDQVQTLYSELESQRMMWSEKEVSIRREIQNATQARNKVMNENWQRRMEEREKSLIELHEFKLAQLEEYYERKLNANSKRPRLTNVINLDDSEIDNLDSSDVSNLDDAKEALKLKTDEVDKLRTSLREVQERISALQADVTRFSFDMQLKDQEITKTNKQLTETENELITVKQKNRELETLLRHAKAEFQELELTVKNNELEVFNLHEKNADLNEQLLARATDIVEHVEYVEQLEEKLNEVNLE